MFQLQDIGKNKLFIDAHNRSIYFRHSNKSAYIVPSSEMTKFKVFYYRYFVCMIAFFLSNNYFFDFPYALGLSILLLVYMEWYFQNKLMMNYNMIKNYDISKQNTEKILLKEPKQKTILRIVLYILFGILIVANAHIEQYGLPLMAGSYIIAVFAVLRCIQMAKVLKQN